MILKERKKFEGIYYGIKSLWLPCKFHPIVCLGADMSRQAIPSYSARRSLFEHYVKTRVEEERKEKRAAQKAAIEGFKQLLDEASEFICLII
ncbi:hypothetical protein Ahy_B08g092150 isoform A [Arachis hypogaea]|uniref:Uncharacterized protein n=1 Tax=Arachis hypogaea TaxID=3818 RepID=A0A444Y3G4_ARAHY|nr:hypothetical protein Ahy_B08g092150 isoform A [Arachis hypogaea]